MVRTEMANEKVHEIINSLPIKPEEKAIAKMGVLVGANPTQFLVGALSRSETEKAEAQSPKRRKAKCYTPTEKVIVEMLTESTGANILDSGGAYGRSWQRNREVTDFRKRSVLKVTVWNDGQTEITLDLFHYLTSYLELDKEAKTLNREMKRFAKTKDEYGFSLAESFAEHLKELGKIGSFSSFNSYNGDSMLSQVIQGVWLGDSEYPEYLILQIHNGCDVRGGYTEPQIFHVRDFEEMLVAEDDLNAGCGCVQAHSDDQGYHWYGEWTDNGQSTIDNGERPKPTTDDKMPPFWKTQPKTEGAKNWEYKLVCDRCETEVSITSALDY